MLWSIAYLLGLIACLLIAVLYLIFVPKVAMGTKGLVGFVLKYAHSLVWFLLATACAFAHYDFMNLVKCLAFSALLVYIIFIITLCLILVIFEDRWNYFLMVQKVMYKI